MLNRPSTATVEEAAPELETLVVPEEDVYIGGPVQPTAIVVVAEFEHADDAGVPIFSTVGFVAAGSEPSAVEAASSRARVFAGFAGWAQDSWRASWNATTGSWNRPAWPTSSRPSRTTCGVKCSTARAASTRW